MVNHVKKHKKVHLSGLSKEQKDRASGDDTLLRWPRLQPVNDLHRGLCGLGEVAVVEAVADHLHGLTCCSMRNASVIMRRSLLRSCFGIVERSKT